MPALRSPTRAPITSPIVPATHPSKVAVRWRTGSGWWPPLADAAPPAAMPPQRMGVL
jgi:hypothetical protein